MEKPSKLYNIGIEKWANELAEKCEKSFMVYFLWWHISIKSMGEPQIDFPNKHNSTSNYSSFMSEILPRAGINNNVTRKKTFAT